jgi:hypothetical protein
MADAPKIGGVKSLIFIGCSIFIVANFGHLATKGRGIGGKSDSGWGE